MNASHHLLFALYIMRYSKARDSKIKLLHTLNAFRAVQKRLAVEMMQMGTRDRAMTDCYVQSPLEDMGNQEEEEEKDEDGLKADETAASLQKADDALRS